MITMSINRPIGITPMTLAYGLYGKILDHLCRIYFIPCATKMASGKMKRIIICELSPEINKVKIVSKKAIEFREAKKPLKVEMKPIMARVMAGRP